MATTKSEVTKVFGVLAKVDAKDGDVRKKLTIIPGQGSIDATAKLACDSGLLNGFSVGTIVVVDMRGSKESTYYIADNEPKLFSGDIIEYMHDHDYGTGKKPEPEVKIPEQKIDPAEAEKYKIKAPAIPKGTIIMEKAKWNAICAAIMLDQYPIVLGPKGCGKTLTAKAVADSLGMEFHAFNLGQAFKPKKFFVGGLGANEQGTYFVPSEFYNAFCSDRPTLIFLDEITRTPAQAANFIMTITDRKQSYIYNEDEGKRVLRGANVRFMAAGNMGMEYVDTRTMDGAFKDRFTPFHLEYMTEKQEIGFLNGKFPVAKVVDITKLVQCAGIIRKACDTGSISQSISTRKLEDLTAYLQGGFDFEVVNEMFLSIFVNGNIDERSEVRSLLQSKI